MPKHSPPKLRRTRSFWRIKKSGWRGKKYVRRWPAKLRRGLASWSNTIFLQLIRDACRRFHSTHRTGCMIESSLSRRYTKALFQLACEAGQEEKIGQELESFLGAYTGSELQKVLTI